MYVHTILVEEFLVVFADAAAEEGAMMINTYDTNVTEQAVVCAHRSQDLLFLLLLLLPLFCVFVFVFNHLFDIVIALASWAVSES